MRWFPIALGILLAVLVMLFLGLRTDFFARGVGRLATKRLFGGTGFSVSVERVEGSILQDVTLKGLKIHCKDPKASFDLFRAEELSVRYEALSLLKRSPRIEDMSMTKPVLRLKADSTGTFILPSFGGGGDVLPSFVVERFSIEDGHVIVQTAEESDALSDVNLVGSVRSGGTELHLVIGQGSARDAGRDFALRSLKGRIALLRDAKAKGASSPGATRIALDSLSVVLDESAFVSSGTIVPSTRLFDLVVDAEPVDIDEIKRILHLETSHYGEVKGKFAVKGKPQRFRLAGTVNGVLSGYALSEFDVNLLRDGDVIRLDSLAGGLNGARVEGTGSYMLEAPNILSVEAGVRGLDLSRGFAPGEELPETRFNGKVKLAYRVQGKALSFAVDLGEGDFLGLPFAEALARGSYADDTLRIDDVALRHPTHSVSARGTIIGGSAVSFIFNVECAAKDTIFGYFDIAEYRADARLNGRWEGTLDAWDLRMSGSCGNLAYYEAFVPEGEVKLAITKNSERDSDYTVQFDLDGPGCRIGPANFTGVSLSLESRNYATNIKRLDLSGENLKAAITANVEREGNEYAVRFKECTLDALGETWLGGGAFTVHIGDTLMRFDDIQFHSKGGAAYVNGTLGVKSKAVEGRFVFERFGLDMVNRAGFLKTPVTGKAHGAIVCSGSYDDPSLGIDIVVDGGRIDTFAIDSLRIKADYGRGRYLIDSLLVASPSGSLTLGGEVSGMPVRELTSRPAVALKHASVSVKSSCRDLELVPLLSLAGVRELSGGRLNGSLSISDSLVHPLVSFTGQIRGLGVSSFRIPSIDCVVTVDHDGLGAEGTMHVSPTHEGSFHGAMPFVPVGFLYSVDRTRPVSFDIDLPEGDLGDLPTVTDLVAEAAGRYSGRLSVTGTVASPHLYGDLSFRNASFRLSGMEERYNQVNAKVLLDDTLVTIAELGGREGKKGTFGCTGWIGLKGWKPAQYGIAFNAEEFVLASLSNVLAIVSGKVKVGTRIENGAVLPVITGSCEVKQSEVYYDLGSLSSSPEKGAVEAPNWFAAVDLKIPGNTWIRTPDARVELQGNVTLYNDEKGMYLRGDLNLVRGWYNVYNNKFTITSGKLQFVTAGGFRPVVDVEAETRDPEGRKIYLTLQWHQDDLEPKLALRHEDAGYSETDIWKMLGGGVVAGEGADASWDARGTAQNLAANYVERMLNSQMEGVTIELEAGRSADQTSGADDFRSTKIAVGKYLSEGLYVKYKQGLSISSAREIEVEYRISDLLVLRSEVIRYFEKAIQGNSPRSSDEINVDLKLRWEF
jgi:hypothetical protein